MLLAIDEAYTDRVVVEYPYFERAQPVVFEDGGTYVDTDVTVVNNVSHMWNQDLGLVVTALGETGMALLSLAEHDSVPWDALPGRMVRDDSGEWRLAERPWRLAASYTLQALRR